MDFIVAFLIGFLSYWVLSKGPYVSLKQILCPLKESVFQLAKNCSNESKILKKEISEYSIRKIGEGHFEYVDVLETLIKKEKNDKS